MIIVEVGWRVRGDVSSTPTPLTPLYYPLLPSHTGDVSHSSSVAARTQVGGGGAGRCEPPGGWIDHHALRVVVPEGDARAEGDDGRTEEREGRNEKGEGGVDGVGGGTMNDDG